jgi:HAD superfamily hydrolase (TIGR01509 family)
MLNGIKAVIFDMDGVIIDSEPLWRRVMIRSFTEAGIPFTENDCRITTGLRFKEVAAYWFGRHNITHIPVDEFDTLVIQRLSELIRSEGTAMRGVFSTLKHLKEKGYRIAVGTSSNTAFMNTVMDALKIRHYFDVLCSAEHMAYGKPHPEVFLACATQLGVHPKECLVIEDSINGIVAAKAAQMKVIAIPDEESKHNPKFVLADYRMESLEDFAPGQPVF